jgi:hypothetical protein
MAFDLREIAAALKTSSVREMAAILDMPIPPTLSVTALIYEFLDQAKPRPPANLQISTGGGTVLSWSDPGANHFFRATSFNANFWDTGDMVTPIEDRHQTTATVIHSSFEVQDDRHYTLHVQAFNEFEGVPLSSPVSVTTISTVSSGGGNGWEVSGDAPEDSGGGGDEGGDDGEEG